MNPRSLALVALALVASSCATTPQPAAKRPPNVVVIYADDLGYGDLPAYGATGLATPAVDRLASEGLRFTDAYAPAATCTPSRYALLTGDYGFRNRAEILPGDAPALIRPGTATVATMLRDRGYATAVIGKWHLGLGDGAVDWNAEVKPGPLEIGFDYSFLLPSTVDRVPTVYLEGHRVAGLDPADPLSVSYKERIGRRPVGIEHPELLRYKADRQHSDTIINGVSRIGFMAGGDRAVWDEADFHTLLADKAIGFMRANRDRPFFLYLPLNQPHVPRMPAKRFEGATTMGPRGDSIVEMDWIVGRVMDEIRRLGIEGETLVVFSSDNGPVLNDGYEDGAVELIADHKPWGPLRGGKYSAFEAGTRVPMITWWPGHIVHGTSHAIVSQIDLFATLAGLADARLPDTVAIDSQDMAGAWLGRDPDGRASVFTESVASHAVRAGPLKYIAPSTNPEQAAFVAGKGIESAASARPQLYDLSRDLGERDNLANRRPEDVKRLQALLARIEARTRAHRKP